MTILAPLPIQTFKDNNGNPLAGGLLYTYVAGTSTPQTTYLDVTGASPNTNPVVLNSRGEAQVWLTAGLFYKFILQDSAASLIWTVDQITGGAAVVASVTAPAIQAQTYTAVTTTGTSTAYLITTSPVAASLAAGQRYRINLHIANGVAPTLARDGLTATAFKVYNSAGAKVAPAAAALPALFDAEYDGVDYVVLNPLPAAVVAGGTSSSIQPITASIATGSLTVSVNPTTLDFRSANLGSGAVATRILAAASSVVVPSTATLGTVSGIQSRIAVLLLDNAGTLETAVVNIAGGNDLTETGVISTTAISAAATAANVIYSTTARTGVAYRVVGTVQSTQATAGTWATAPSTIQGSGGQTLAAMSSAGFGQTWQDVTASRVLSTTYYNTTGKPITVSVTVLNTVAAGRVACTVNGLSIGGNGLNTGTPAGGDQQSNMIFLVPPGASYSAGGVSFSTMQWCELR